MGRGDIRSRKGKIKAGSYGNSRPHKLKTSTADNSKVEAVAKEKPKKTK